MKEELPLPGLRARGRPSVFRLTPSYSYESTEPTTGRSNPRFDRQESCFCTETQSVLRPRESQDTPSANRDTYSEAWRCIPKIRTRQEEQVARLVQPNPLASSANRLPWCDFLNLLHFDGMYKSLKSLFTSRSC